MGAKLVDKGIFKMIRSIIACTAIIISVGCTWQDAAKVTANSVAFTAMALTGNAGAYNMNADLAGQAAGDLVDLAFEDSNCTD